ncbi:MAG: hypothetical protein AABX07_02285 [Nanoarchaeota archaeon]
MARISYSFQNELYNSHDKGELRAGRTFKGSLSGKVVKPEYVFAAMLRLQAEIFVKRGVVFY